MKRFILCMLTLLGLTACSAPITVDYGDYPHDYERIVRQFYQDKTDITPIEFVFAFQPKKYEQKNYGFHVPFHSKIWLNAYLQEGQAMKGYLVCAIETNHHDGYKIDALLIHQGKVISVVYNTRMANINGRNDKLCYQENNWLLGALTEIISEQNNRFIDNFIEQLRKERLKK